MSITSSTVFQITEPDGSKLVHEKHVDQDGKVCPRFYRAGPGADIAANLAAYAVTLAEVLAEQEADEVLQ